MSHPLIELKGISKTFGSNVVLDNIDLTIYRGDALAIIGPSGTGKSTILRIISGLLAPNAGAVYIQGRRRQGLIEDAEDPIDISLVFQQSALFDSLTVEQNVGFMLFRHSKLADAQIRELVNQKLELVGLPGINDRLPAELSGGMRKRVSLARSIMPNPKSGKSTPDVLLYDEPTAGLDPIASTVIEDVIRQVQGAQGGCSTYVVVTHQDSTIRRTANQVVFLYQGQVQWQGSRSQAYSADNEMLRQFFSGRVDGPIHASG